MSYSVLKDIFLPFLGTTLGAGCVFFIKNKMNENLHKSLLGFASGVMVAASVWSLILPSIDKSAHLGALSFLPALIGVWIGVLTMLILDKALPEPHIEDMSEKNAIGRSMLFMAVTIHNVPEGMAVGAAIAALLSGDSGLNAAGVFALSAGIAIQNIPEGSIISMPLAAEGKSKVKAFLYGVLSGVAEPAGAIITIIFASFVTPALPYMLSFAAGAMLFVSVNELIPQMFSGKKSYAGTVMFALGFTVMMCLDVALG